MPCLGRDMSLQWCAGHALTQHANFALWHGLISLCLQQQWTSESLQPHPGSNQTTEFEHPPTPLEPSEVYSTGFGLIHLFIGLSSIVHSVDMFACQDWLQPVHFSLSSGRTTASRSVAPTVKCMPSATDKLFQVWSNVQRCFVHDMNTTCPP